ncbi:protein serine/threonine phosphatase 2C [Xylariomycetidae sp. FL0641]|nr:protein serine/threonine phosphatase 2C [Xylariomycetidae sp. FL0641]
MLSRRLLLRQRPRARLGTAVAPRPPFPRQWRRPLTTEESRQAVVQRGRYVFLLLSIPITYAAVHFLFRDKTKKITPTTTTTTTNPPSVIVSDDDNSSSSSTAQSQQVPDLDALGTSDRVGYAPPPSPAEVTAQLNARAFTVAGTIDGITRYDGAQVASNAPCEDAWLHGSFSAPSSSSSSSSSAAKWMAWGVFDGHCGWQTSDLLTRELVPHVRRALADVPAQDDAKVEQALKTAFTALDDALVRSAPAVMEDATLSFAEKARRLEAAYAGACALLALWDPSARTLRVASTGDCRAVLGTRRRPSTGDGNRRWEATELSTDCTGATASEAARLRAQFPDEPDVVRGGRVWGMQPSRTFGDGMWKWPAALKATLRARFNGLALPSAARYSGYKEGPYLTAEPLVTATRIPDDRPAFLVLATDGLWDTMSSAQAVDLVGRWLDRQGGGAEPVEETTKREAFGPVVLGWERQCRYEEAKATTRDANNAAVHLVRNGLGGADDEAVRAALTFRYPNSRDIRDDITVQVVFFAPKGGE